MAFNDPRHEVVGLTIAAGNVGLAHTVAQRAEAVRSRGRRRAGVRRLRRRRCCIRRAMRPTCTAATASATSATTPPARTAEAEHAALAILRLSHEHAGRLLLVALGPLTNLALALKLDPTLPHAHRRAAW